MDYKGYEEITLNEEQLAQFYQKELDLSLSLLENEYLLVRDTNGQIVDKFCFQNGVLRKLKWESINNDFSGIIKPRNIQQEFFMDMLQNGRSTIKVVTGQYGSGKTFLMVSNALNLIKKGVFEKIVWVRNNIEVKNTTPLGALPGGLFEKLLVYAMPVADHAGGLEGLNHLVDQGKLEIEHLGFLRGRDIKNSIIISSEAENLTKEHVQLLIGRVGEGSALYLDGDLKQVDKDVFKSSSGLEKAVEKFRGNELFGYVHLEKSERSQTARLADLLDD